jgi:hypothetical protein
MDGGCRRFALRLSLWENNPVKTNPILEEVWRIKDQLAAESGYDMNRFVEQLCEWSAAHPHPGRMVHSAEELRQLVAEKERERDKQSAMTLNDKPPSKS